MPLKITIKKDYILLEPKEGLDYREIRRGIARLFYVSELPAKNDIWIFRQGPERLSYDDLHKLRDIIKENYPKNPNINKTAIVVESGLQTSMAEAFTQITADLPHKFRVFSNLQAAETWVKE
jgi:hypothetical protein